jgi:ubiquinone/menaquinone biosynthesis C-methylase UbiE
MSTQLQSAERFYWAARARLVPGLRSSQYAYRDKLREHLDHAADWLDLGCGRHILPDWMPPREVPAIPADIRLVGLDYDHPSLCDNQIVNLKTRGDLEYLPFRADSFDLVTANMVVEHLREPTKVLSEVQRILKPGGICILHTPNAWSYQVICPRMVPERLKMACIRFLESRVEEDVFRTFYRLNTAGRLRAVASECGLVVDEIEWVNASPKTVRVKPLLLVELLMIRILSSRLFARFRGDLLAVLRKPE